MQIEGFKTFVKNEYGNPKLFENLSWTCYQLYCLVVVPKELHLYNTSVDELITYYFEIDDDLTIQDRQPLRNINSFRNSIAHANFILGEKEMTFKDYKPKETTPHWVATISIEKYRDGFLPALCKHALDTFKEEQKKEQEI